MRTCLNIGAGRVDLRTPSVAVGDEEWKVATLDIDPKTEPDYCADVTDMSCIPDASFEMVYAAHLIEHLPPCDTQQALAEVLRILKPGGRALFVAPDLEAVAWQIIQGRLDYSLYTSQIGPITPRDMIYGHGRLSGENHFMRHLNGFTAETLAAQFLRAGFARVEGGRNAETYEIYADALKAEV